MLSRYFISFLSEGQRSSLVSTMWHGEKNEIFPLSRLQMGVILRRGTAIGAGVC